MSANGTGDDEGAERDGEITDEFDDELTDELDDELAYELDDDDEPSDEGDAEDDDEPYERRVHPAIFASNWRTVLAVDGAVGVAVLLAGVILAITWNPFVGGFIGSVGFVYVAFVVRRGQDWARQRREAGLL